MVPRWAELATYWLLVTFIVGGLLGVVLITRPFLSMGLTVIVSGLALFQLVDELVTSRMKEQRAAEQHATEGTAETLD